MAITIDREALVSIAGSCQQSGQTIQEEAAKMQAYMGQLREALAGIPSLSLADRFNEWNALFSKMSQALDESNDYLRNIVQTVDEFVASLGR